MQQDEYLRAGKASDLKNPKDRALFRLFEILPGALSWGALIAVIILSWKAPLWVAIFIILFVIFWVFRTIYFSFHLWSSYKKMGEHEKTNWIERLNTLPQEKDWHAIYHLVVIPMYRESLEVMRGTFDALVKANYPKENMIVVLACEERSKESVYETARVIEREFGSKFFRFLTTWHPGNIPGELAGKGSNETWAARQAQKQIIDPAKIPYENVIFTSLDADTYVLPHYFSCLTYHYCTVDKPTRTSFQPIPFYTNNIWQAPVFSRIFAFSSTFWHTMNQARQEKLVTFSSHSMSFRALVDVGFKQTNVVSDDSRIFWQCFLAYDGDYRVQPLYYPVSMDANVARSFWRTLLNIYKQQRRWAYGVGDIPYFMLGFIKNKKIPLRKKFSLGLELIEGHFSWATASIMIFLLGWLPLVIGGPEFGGTLISYNLPKIISRIMTIAMIGLVGSIYLSFLVLPPKPPEYGKRKYIIFAFGWILFPIMMLFFTSLPALDAQTRWMLGRYMGFWPTEKFRRK